MGGKSRGEGERGEVERGWRHEHGDEEGQVRRQGGGR